MSSRLNGTLVVCFRKIDFFKWAQNRNRRHFFFSLLNRLKAEFNDVSCDL